MSTQSMKSLMVKNQKRNRMQLEKIANNFGFKKVTEINNSKQEEVAEFTANTLRISIDESVFKKSKIDRQLVSIAKSQYKYNKESGKFKDLRDEMLSVITKARIPNWDNIVLKIS